MYTLGQRCRETDRMPAVDSEFLVEWLLVEIGPIARTAAARMGWRHVWWWINRGRTERPQGTGLVSWGGGSDA